MSNGSELDRPTKRAKNDAQSLQNVAARGAQKHFLVRCFHALGSDLQAHCMPQCNDGRHDGSGVHRVTQAQDKAFVDLDTIDFKIPQMVLSV